MGILEIREQQESQVFPEAQASKETVEQQVQMEPQALLGPKATLVLMDLRVPMVHQDLQEGRDHLDQWEVQDHQDQLDHQDHQDLREILVLKEMMVMRDHLEILVM